MQLGDFDVLGAGNLLLTAVNLFNSQRPCVCKCEATANTLDVAVVREILQHKTSSCTPSYYIPWWLIWIALCVGILIGGLGSHFGTRLWLRFFGASNSQEAASSSGRTVPATPRTLALRDGRSR